MRHWPVVRLRHGWYYVSGQLTCQCLILETEFLSGFAPWLFFPVWINISVPHRPHLLPGALRLCRSFHSSFSGDLKFHTSKFHQAAQTHCRRAICGKGKINQKIFLGCPLFPPNWVTNTSVNSCHLSVAFKDIVTNLTWVSMVNTYGTLLVEAVPNLSPNYEDIRDATHSPKREGQHLSLTFDTVLGGNVHQRHICNKCVADGLYT